MTREEYTALYKKMLTDDEFLTKVDTLKTKDEIYDAYKTYGYTDMNYDDFMKEFSDKLNGIIKAYKEKTQNSRQLSDEELDEIVGGFEWFNFIASIVSLIPAVGPLISGVAKAIYDGVNGKGFEKIFMDVAIGYGGGLMDGIVTKVESNIGKIITGVCVGSAKLTANTLVDEFLS